MIVTAVTTLLAGAVLFRGLSLDGTITPVDCVVLFVGSFLIGQVLGWASEARRS